MNTVNIENHLINMDNVTFMSTVSTTEDESGPCIVTIQFINGKELQFSYDTMEEATAAVN